MRRRGGLTEVGEEGLLPGLLRLRSSVLILGVIYEGSRSLRNCAYWNYRIDMPFNNSYKIVIKIVNVVIVTCYGCPSYNLRALDAASKIPAVYSPRQ